MRGRLFYPLFSLVLLASLPACQIGYLTQAAQGEFAILWARVPLEESLKNPALTEEEKDKLSLTQEVRSFAQKELKLNTSKNYSTYVALDRPYASYVVSAAPKWSLHHHIWTFPIVGSVPYKGYFNEAAAKEEAKDLESKGLDTYLRGVSAFSTLGWFNDPLLSSMLRYKPHHLVNTIIHELTHSTIYIANSADFNERLAVFVGNLGTELFYEAKEGKNSPSLQLVYRENHDEKLFSEFITKELSALDQWYQATSSNDDSLRQEKFKEIQRRFADQVAPKMLTKNYSNFPHTNLNNAKLLLYKTYVYSLSDFQEIYESTGRNMEAFLDKCRSLGKN